VQELVEGNGARFAVLGTTATLEAVSAGRVHKLVIADVYQGVGGECEKCGSVTTEGATCSLCGGPTTPVVDLRERVVERALDKGAIIESVSGDAAVVLMAQGGMGAWTRY
jgi:peptide subunit release factor 1 (eRF1)